MKYQDVRLKIYLKAFKWENSPSDNIQQWNEGKLDSRSLGPKEKFGWTTAPNAKTSPICGLDAYPKSIRSIRSIPIPFLCFYVFSISRIYDGSNVDLRGSREGPFLLHYLNSLHMIFSHIENFPMTLLELLLCYYCMSINSVCNNAFHWTYRIHVLCKNLINDIHTENYNSMNILLTFIFLSVLSIN